MEILQNNFIKITVNPKGAELTSLYDKTTATEYMWGGDPAFWGKHSPVLFPIVGTLKEDTYLYKDKAYTLGRHGFARDHVFEVLKENEQLVFSLRSGEGTLQQFPFHFLLQIIYELKEKQLSVSYRITNTGIDEMYFSIGGHPAFRLPVDNTTAYDDYFLEFEKEEEARRWPISKDGLIEKEPVPVINGKILPLSKELFQKDALVFKQLRSHAVSLRSGKTNKGFHFDFTGFPFLGIWAAKNADFVCIEPWCGIADSVDSTRDITQKEGIQQSGAGEVFERTWSVAIF